MASPERSRGLLWIVLACLMLLPIHTLPLLAAEQVVETPAVTNVAPQNAETQKPSLAKKLVGFATYYAKKFQGRRTTSGERYHPEKLTAAHQSLPLGTKIRVRNLANNKEVTVVVNDRCRRRGFPFIDLSRAAAKKLGFFGAGKANVAIIPLKEDES
ncbi:septal ring lytic transglycosylase RlpA family protein [Geomonas sp.]|uniref:septal ring lytic transglycosylase RlpA family protein n=1 Tax=Geomonas sp. TaxID=2651584 RepID=UPI002B45D588|nr:septal ring lytic transglycosylase RlpA family protein [Geomonas sp.]HJV35981.1 septal ring lytic transglycosylase RlpA family protein [Geomonas sp.]